MAIAVRQSNKSNTGGSSTPGTSFSSLPLTGSLIYVHITSYQNSGTTPTITGVADNQGNGAYSLVETQVTTGGSDNYRHAVYILQATAAPSGTFTVTVTFSASVSSFITVVEVTGQAASQPHKQVKATGSSTTATATFSTATTVANAIILGGMTHNNGTPSITPNATNLPTQLQEEEDNNSTEAGNVAYRAVSATGTYTVSWAIGSSTTWAVIGVVIAEAAGGTTFPVSIGGTLSSAGALTKQDRLTRAGTLTSAGTLVKQNQKRLAGTLTTAGALAKQDRRTLTGTLSLSGALVKQDRRSLTGTLTSAGALTSTKVVLVSLAGTLTTAGSLTKRINKVLGGTLSSSGALVKQIRRFLSGALTTAGSLSSQIPGALPFRDDFTAGFDPEWDEQDTDGVLTVVDGRAFFEYPPTTDAWGDPGLATGSILRSDLGAFVALVRLTNKMDNGVGIRVSVSPSPTDSAATGAGNLSVLYPNLFTANSDEFVNVTRQRSKDLLLSVIKRESGGWIYCISEGKSGGEWPVFPDAAIVDVSGSESDANVYAHLATRKSRVHVDYAAALAAADLPSSLTTRLGAALVSESSGTRTAGTSSITNAGVAPRVIEAVLSRGANNDTRAVICFRGSNTSYANCWKFKGEFDRFSLHNTVGMQTQSGAVNMPASTPTHLKVIDTGDRIDCYVNGVRRLTWNDTAGASNTYAGTACDTGASLSVSVTDFAAWKTVTLNSNFGPFPQVPDAVGAAFLTDSLDDTNGTSLPTHNADWVVTGGMGTFDIQSNRARITASATNGIATRNAITPQHKAQVTVGVPADPGTYPIDVFAGPICRYTDVNNFIQARLLYQDGPSPEIEVWEYIAGTGNLIAYVNLTGTVTGAGDYVVGLACRGNQVAAYLNGENVAQGTTALLTGTRAGFGVFDTNPGGQPTFNDFSIASTVASVSLSGALSFAGTLVKQGFRTLSGTLTSSGTVRKQTNRSLAGTLASVGALIKRPLLVRGGTLSSSATVTPTIVPGGNNTFFVSLTATLASAGSLTRRVAQTLTGSLGTIGTLIQRVNRRLTGTLTESGTLTSGKLINLTRTGTLTPGGGAVTSRIIRGVQIAATISPHGDLDIVIIRQPQIPAPEFDALSDLAPPQGTLLSDSSPVQGTLLVDDGPPEFIPRS